MLIEVISIIFTFYVIAIAFHIITGVGEILGDLKRYINSSPIPKIIKKAYTCPYCLFSRWALYFCIIRILIYKSDTHILVSVPILIILIKLTTIKLQKYEI